jgi:hypothetical protein
MSNIKNTHIQGNLTLSANTTNVADHGSGVLLTDFIQETTESAGIKLLNSHLDIYSTGLESSDIILTNDVLETAILSLNGTANASGNGAKSLTLVNNSGDSYIQSRGGIGLKISQTTGNVTIQSTAESINSNSASLIVKGGLVTNKSLVVDTEIRGNDGYHILQNTSPSESVLKITNTSTSGYSSIDFVDSSDVLRLQLGYGNSGTSGSYTSQSYLQSSSGSLLLRSNNTDSVLLKTDGSVEFKNSNSSTSYTTGAITSLGGISISNTADAVGIANGGSLTVAGGISIAKKAFVGTDLDIGNTIRMVPITTPSNPTSGVKLYIDSIDGLFKSVNSSGVVKGYNTNTTKGDLITHNGTTDVRLPVGTSGQILSSNPLSSTGLSWIDNNGSPVSTTQKSNIFTMYVKDSPTYIIQKTYGSWYSYVYPLCLDGSSCIYFSSKSSHTANKGGVYRMCTNKSLITDKTIELIWEPYRSISVYKTYDEGAGDYSNSSNENLDYSSVSLSGTSWVSLGNDYTQTTGAFYVSVYSDNEGPCSTFVICKSNGTTNTGSLFIISSSASSTGAQIRIRWLSNSGIEIRKTSANNDGSYNVIDNFKNIVSTSVTLTGTSTTALPKGFFGFYENKTFAMRIYSAVVNSPKAIFFVSKNTYLNSGTQTSNKSPGATSLEKLFLTWSPSSLIQVYKDGNNYDGDYNIDMIQIY